MQRHPAFVPLPPPEEAEPEHDFDYLTGHEREAGGTVFRGLWQYRPQA